MKKVSIQFLSFLLGLILIFPVALADDYTEQQAFTELLGDTLQAALPDYEVQMVDDRTLRIFEEGEMIGELAVENAFAEYEKSGESDMLPTVEHYVQAVLQMLNEETVALTAEAVFPILKNQDYIDTIVEMGVEPLYEPFLENLVMLYVVDTPNSVRPLLAADLESLAMTEDQLAQIALHNLQALLGEELQSQQMEGITFFFLDGTYETSLIFFDLLPTVFAEQTDQIVVGVPERGVLMVADAADLEAVAIMREYAQESYAASGYPVTPDLLIWKDGEYQYLAEQ